MLTTNQQETLQVAIDGLVENHAETCRLDGEEHPPEQDMVNEAIDTLLFRIEEDGVWGLKEDGTISEEFFEDLSDDDLDDLDKEAEEFLKSRKIR